jgi:hypothetical protein
MVPRRSFVICLIGLPLARAKSAVWRAATESELKEIIPARAEVEKERIETELRTASGITDGKGNFVAAVLLITAGYSADGKYSHYLMTRAPLKIGDFELKPGEYALGWTRGQDALNVKFYNAHTGELVGAVEAKRTAHMGRIESFHIYPPGEKSLFQIGRFAFSYQLRE